MENFSVDLLSEYYGNIQYTKIIGVDVDGSPIMKFTIAGNGRITGDIEFTEMWNITSKQKLDGNLHGEGIGVCIVKYGDRNETIIVKSNTTSTYSKDRTKQYISANFYESFLTEQFSFMKQLVGVFNSNIDESGIYNTKVWKWN